MKNRLWAHGAFAVALFLLFCSTLRGAAPSLLFHHYDLDAGTLTNDGIICMLEDSHGYVWIGTRMGLNRYDGRDVKPFPLNGLPSVYILSLCEDKDGNIWIGTSDGIACYNGHDGTLSTIELDAEVLPFFVSSIACDAKGEIWFDVGDENLYSIAREGVDVTRHNLGLPLCNKRLDINSSGTMIINCSQHGIYQLNGETLLKVDKDGLFDKDEINNPVFSRNNPNLLYVASKRNGLCEINLHSGTTRVLYNWATGQKPVSLYMGQGETLYVSTSSGLVSYCLADNSSQTISHAENNVFSISGDYITCSLIDSRGGTWVGTKDMGLNYSPKEKLFKIVSLLSSGQSLGGCMVRAVSEDSAGGLWIATERSGLLKYSMTDNTFIRMYEHSIPFFLTAVLCDGDWIWVGTQNGVLRIDRKTGCISQYYTDQMANQENRVLTLFRTTDGGILAGCTSGVLKYQRSADSFKPVAEFSGLSVERFAQDASGRIWIATYADGMLCWDPSLEKDCVKKYGRQTSMMLSSVYVDRNQCVWAVGTGSNLSRYDESSHSFINLDAELRTGAFPAAAFISALQDADGYLWTSTSSGLFRIDTHSMAVRRFTVDDGLLNNLFGRASLITSAGQIIFGFSSGLVLLHPNINSQIATPSSYTDIASIYAGGRRISSWSGDVIRLPHDVGSLRFDFATPVEGSACTVLARLSPHDAMWHDVSNRMSISTPPLSPGTYMLEFSGHEAVKIVIAPPFFRSKLGIALIVLISLFSFFVAIILANSMARRSQRRKEEKERFKQDQALLEEKMSFISNVVHEIKTPLTLIKTPLNTLLSSEIQNEQAQSSLHVIANGIRSLDNLSKDLLSYIRVEKSAYNVVIEDVDVADVLRLLGINFKDLFKDRNLRYNSSVEPNPLYAKADAKSLNIILNNLISNAVKYSESWIEVDAALQNGKVIISVKNDGALIPKEKREEIFKPFVSLDKRKDAYQHSFGIGLPFSRKLAELQDGVLEFVPGKCNEFRLSLNASTGRVSPTAEAENCQVEGRSTVLIIEDNVQLCDYLSQKLSEEYNVLSSFSAERGFSFLSSKAVDIVVTDLNMPGIGGEALCRRISSDFETSHIPIIVISALTDEDLKLRCLKSGASVFIEKPFTIEFLKASIANLLEKMSKMRQSASQDTSGRFNLSRFGIRDRDDEFLKKVSAIIDSHLDDSSFSVKQLEDELYISHSSLNRKMTGLMKMSPIEFIRMRRLIAAAKILEDGRANVSEVAFMVGFSSPSYFSKCFRKQFGVTPREFVERKLG